MGTGGLRCYGAHQHDNLTERFPIPTATHLFIQDFLHDPPAGECKLNIDATLAKAINRGSMGAVCRAYDRSYLGSLMIVFEGITDSGCLEAMACREALALAADLNVGDAMIASDCMEVVKGLHGQDLGLSSHVLMEVKETARAHEKGWTIGLMLGECSSSILLCARSVIDLMTVD
jgi:hypothetical protein